MSDNDSGKVSMQIDGHVCTIAVDNVSKNNAYTPAMLDRLAELLTEYEDNDDLWVAIFCSVGEHTTAGLDMPRFFGPTAEPNRRKPGLVDPFGKHVERARELAAIICECAPLGLRATKRAALTFIEAGEQAAVACIPEIKDQVFATDGFKEGIRSFVERRQAKFVGR